MVEERQRQRTDFGRFSPKKGPYRHSETPKNPNDFIDREPYRHREIPNPGDYIKPYAEPYRPDFDRKPPNYFPMSSYFNQFDNSGIMLAAAGNPMIDRAKDVYAAVDPFMPDLKKGELRYDWNKPFGGGMFDYGIGYGPQDEDWNAYFTWGKNW